MARLHSLFFALALIACGRGELVINTSALPTGRVGAAYQGAITAAGGEEEGYVWRLTSGTLPSGLEIAAQGTPSTSVTGTPAEAGTFDFLVEVVDVKGNKASGTVRLVIDGT